MTVEIPLRLKYRTRKLVKKTKGGHNDGRRKLPGYAKHRRGNGINHVPWVMVLINNKRRFMSQSEWEAMRAFPPDE